MDSATRGMLFPKHEALYDAMSEQSSIISISDGFDASDTDDMLHSSSYNIDSHKYMMPWTRDATAPATSTITTSAPRTTVNQSFITMPASSHTQADPNQGSDTYARTDSGDDDGNDDKGDSYENEEEDDIDNDAATDPDTDWLGARMSRAGSIYSMSRVSFASQLAQLTSIKLPNASSLSAKISAMPVAADAARALADSAEQIQAWIKNASSVLQGLNAEDDVEWAAAAGRDGLDHVDSAINRFEKVIKVYVYSVEELQMRDDIATLPKMDVQLSFMQMERVLKEWNKIKDSLNNIKNQVEMAMEWEELWNSVLGASIGQELDELAGLVFEMEERRHIAVDSNTVAASESTSSVDIDELRTIVEETPDSPVRPLVSRPSLAPPFSPTSSNPNASSLGNMDDKLFSLFARMQPLRASLDFLPMRLSAYNRKANSVFPSACSTLESRKDYLEEQWKKLETDAEALRRELGEDRWLLVFRNSGRQAVKMCDSVSRSLDRLSSSIDDGEHHTDAPGLARKIESYEAKKTHYGPAIERVLQIIDRGVLTRLTVNGEILRLQSDMKLKWSNLQARMQELDRKLLSFNSNVRNRQLRDSISTILSSDHSLASSTIDTPRSSSASSMSRRSSVQCDATPRRAKESFWKSSLPRRVPLSARQSLGNLRSASFPERMRSTTPTPMGEPLLRQFKQPLDKPRWNGSTVPVTNDFKPLSVTEPSPYRKDAPPKRDYTPRSVSSKIPTPSPLSRNSASPSQLPMAPTSTLAPSRALESPRPNPLGTRALSSLANRAVSGDKARTSSPASYSRAPTTPLSRKRSTLFIPRASNDSEVDRSPDFRRSTTATPSGRRSSSLAPPRFMDQSGRRSRLNDTAGEQGSKPVWRF